jgi:hypothetical protein
MAMRSTIMAMTMSTRMTCEGRIRYRIASPKTPTSTPNPASPLPGHIYSLSPPLKTASAVPQARAWCSLSVSELHRARRMSRF